MRIQALPLVLVASLVLSACSAWQSSRVNPSNWFGRSEVVVTDAEAANPLIPPRSNFARPEPVYSGVLVQEVTQLRIEATPTGAIVYSEGLANRQGAYNARLSLLDPENPIDDSGRLVYRFEVLYPDYATPVGTAQSRKIAVAESLTIQDLEGVRVIRVDGSTNARESRRN